MITLLQIVIVLFAGAFQELHLSLG